MDPLAIIGSIVVVAVVIYAIYYFMSKPVPVPPSPEDCAGLKVSMVTTVPNSPAFVKIGENIIANHVITNDGNKILNGKLKISTPGKPLTYDSNINLRPGQSITINNGRWTIRQQDIDAGFVKLTPTVTVVTKDGCTVTYKSEVTVNKRQ